MNIKHDNQHDQTKLNLCSSSSEPNCIWCDQQFQPTTVGGNAKRFCSSGCKNNFNSACRRYGQAQFVAGRIGIEVLRQHR